MMLSQWTRGMRVILTLCASVSLANASIRGTTTDTSTIVERSLEGDTFLYYGNVAWADLPQNVEDAWETIGFNQPKKSWTQQGRDYEDIESKSWFSLENESIFFATLVGFTEDTWDCHINHYYDYYWEELVMYNLSEYFEIIGYTQASWERDDSIDVNDQYWDEIETDVEAALEEICWTKDLWDNYA